MRSVTEFSTPKLNKGNEAKTALLAEGKSPEEVEQSIGESFKFEGEKLKFFYNALTVATDNSEKLTRVLVVSLNEGESVPAKAVKVDDHYYVPEFQQAALSVNKAGKKGDQKGKSDKKDRGPKSSPWGISPEEAAAKKAKK